MPLKMEERERIFELCFLAGRLTESIVKEVFVCDYILKELLYCVELLMELKDIDARIAVLPRCNEEELTINTTK